MPTFGYAQNWGTGISTPTTAGQRGSPTLVRSSSPSGSSDMSWLSALPALAGAASALPTFLSSNSSSEAKSNALRGAVVPALQALASSQGQGTAGSFIPAVAALVSGDEAGALRSGSGAATAALSRAAGAPGWAIGPLATLASGVISGDDKERIQDAMINSGVSSAFSAAGPLGMVAYQVLRMLGMNPAQGVRKQLSDKDYAAEGGDPGKLGGFFGTVGDYDGYTPGEAYYPGTNQLEQNLRLESLAGAEAAGAKFTNDSPAEQAARAARERAAAQQSSQREHQQQVQEERARAAAVAQMAEQERANAEAIRQSNAAPSSRGSTSTSGGNTGRFGQAVGPGSAHINTPSSSSSSGGWSNTGGYSSDGSTSNGSGMSGGTGGAFAQGGRVKNAWGF